MLARNLVTTRKKWMRLLLGLLANGIACSGESLADEYPEPTEEWKALINHPVPEWLLDAKFGIFIHWGPYSVPAWSGGRYSEWYATDMYLRDNYREYHEKNFGKLSEFGYKDFIPLFNAEHFDAKAWAELFRESGARYVIPTAEHHDGFSMYDSSLSDWNSVDMGPRLDFIGELGAAVRKAGLKFGCSYHRERHWGYYTDAINGNRNKPNGFDDAPNVYPEVLAEIEKDPKCAELYGPFELSDAFIADYKARFLDICRKYEPDFMWLDDTPSNSFHPEQPAVKRFMEAHRQMLLEYVEMAAGWNKPVYWNNKRWTRSNYPEGAGCDERDYLQSNAIRPHLWQSSGGLLHSYGFDRTELGRYNSAEYFIKSIVDVSSKGGVFLLDIGPMADGRIHEEQAAILREIGDWLELHGEAVYGTRPWKTFGYRNVRFMAKGQDLFVFDMRPEQGKLTLWPMRGWTDDVVKSVEQVGKGKVDWALGDEGLVVSKDRSRPSSDVEVYRISLAVEAAELTADEFEHQVSAAPDGRIALGCQFATVSGPSLRYEVDKDCLGFWSSKDAYVTWKLAAPAAGQYVVRLTYACATESAGTSVEFRVGDSATRYEVAGTGAWTDFQTVDLGRVKLGEDGSAECWLRALEDPSQAVMNLRQVVLVPVE